MPYIPTQDRSNIDEALLDFGTSWVPENAGELNWLISTFVDNYLNANGVRYAYLNEMMGALECCKLELYRKIGTPYEEVKEAENGRAYTVPIPKVGAY